MKKFLPALKAALAEIVGKAASLSGPSNCIRVTLSSGKEYFGTVPEVHDDYFKISVSYAGGGKEITAVKFAEIASFTP